MIPVLIMGVVDDVVGSIFGKVKSDLTYKAGSEISGGVSSAVKKGVEGDKTLRCPKCKKPIADASLKFCPECGQKLMAHCDKCSMDFPLGTKFCTNCGGKLS